MGPTEEEPRTGAVNAQLVCDAIMKSRDLKGAPLLSFAHLSLGLPNPLLSGPSIVKAYADEQPQDADEDETSPVLTLKRFEELSLAARGRLLLPIDPKKPAAAPSDPAWSRCYMAMPEIDAETLRDGIVQAMHELVENDQATPTGLYVSGAYINGVLDLANLKLPFSVRLIGCAINGAVRAHRSEMVSFDLSGSAVRGVSGLFMVTHGSVRLRRLVSTGVVDFGGAKIDDVFDATDCVVFPLDDPPPKEAFVGDRGIFNLSLADISNEARLIRSRIYGGLTLKGCHIKRSLFLDDAILRAPIAFLERMGADVAAATLPTSGKPDKTSDAPHYDKLALAVRTSRRAEAKLAKELHGNHELESEEAKRRKIYNDFETLAPFKMARYIGAAADGVLDGQKCERGRLFHRLLAESPRARSSCLRADGLRVTGSIYARSVRTSGRVRINYAQIDGSLHLDGARMRSSEDITDGIRNVLKNLEKRGSGVAIGEWPGYVSFAEAQLKLFKADWQKGDDQDEESPPENAQPADDRPLSSGVARLKRERGENENFALDMREVRIEGRVSLKPDNRSGERHRFDRELRRRTADALHAGCECCRFPHRTPEWPRRCACRGMHLSEWLNATTPNAHHHAVYANGQIVLDNAEIGGDVDMCGALANLHRVKPPKLDADTKPSRAFLRLHQAKIGGTLNLRESIGVNGVDGRHAKIDEGVSFARHGVRRDNYKSRALLVRGRMRFSEAEIGGDATFLFDPDYGPDLYLARCKVGGRLHILPAKAVDLYSDIGPLKRRPLSGVRWREKDESNSPPEIDLRSASAKEFGHPEWAWPHQDRLHVEGFTYDQTSAHGPLTPRPRRPVPKNRFPEKALFPSQIRAWERKQLDRESEWLLLRISFAVACVLALIVYVQAANGGFARLDQEVGLWNIAILAACAIFAAMHWAVGVFSTPRRRESEPRAIYWLGLQSASSSVYQRRGLTIPLQPHVQAARVLRSAGLILSANLLERDRLLRRHEQLSWRNNWPVRLLLQIADWTTQFGFDPLRTIVIAFAFVGVAAIAFQEADRRGYVRPIDGDLIQIYGGEAGVFGQTPVHCDQTPRGCAAGVASVYPAFSSTLYAMDVMAPGLDLGQEEYWRPMSSQAEGTTSHLPASPFWEFIFWLSAPILKIIGWLLATAIAVSIITRIEAMISRHEE